MHKIPCSIIHQDYGKQLDCPSLSSILIFHSSSSCSLQDHWEFQLQGTMEELQRHPDNLIEDKPRKVRFKLASSYSGRVLKHVYEDGQELDSPEEQYPHSFIHTKMEMGHLCGLEDTQDQSLYPPTGLIAQRINVYRGVTGCNSLVCGDLPEGIIK